MRLNSCGFKYIRKRKRSNKTQRVLQITYLTLKAMRKMIQDWKEQMHRQCLTCSPMCNTVQTTEHSHVKEKEKSNVSWVQRLCSGEGDPVNKEVKSVTWSLPKLGLPQFDNNLLELPTFILLFKCLVHSQPETDTQRMTHLQCALDGNAKKAIGGTLTHSHLYPEALPELTEQSGIEEAVASVYLKTILHTVTVFLQHITHCCIHPQEFEWRTRSSGSG